MNKKALIIETAYKEFLTNGYKNTSLNKIADIIGFTKPALYYYFKNKEELLKEVFFYHFEMIKTYYASGYNPNSTVKEQIKSLLYKSYSLDFSSILNYEHTESFNHYNFKYEAVKSQPELEEFFENYIEAFSENLTLLLKKGIASGELRDNLDIEAAVFEIGILIEGFAVVSNLYKVGSRKKFEGLFSLFWKGIEK